MLEAVPYWVIGGVLALVVAFAAIVALMVWRKSQRQKR